MPYSLTATLLDSLGVAMCVFDAQDHTLHWNDQFLRFFPEHADHVQVGEAYADNLRRFYRLRLPPEDHHHIERYVQDGLRRHRDQTQPYVFVHRGRKLRVAATPQANGDRVRVWIDLSLAEADVLTAIPSGLTGASAVPERLRVFEQLSDGISVHDADGRTVFANDRFMALYDLRSPTELAGQTYAALVHACWAQADRAAAEDDLNAALIKSTEFEVPPTGLPWGPVWGCTACWGPGTIQTCCCTMPTPPVTKPNARGVVRWWCLGRPEAARLAHRAGAASTFSRLNRHANEGRTVSYRAQPLRLA